MCGWEGGKCKKYRRAKESEEEVNKILESASNSNISAYSAPFSKQIHGGNQRISLNF
jgi:hypothetical protein